MSKHTPGPWIASGDSRVVGDSDQHFLWCGEVRPAGSYRGSISQVQSADHIGGISRGEAEANARLIAAAPDLLASVERVCAQMVAAGLERKIDSASWDLMQDAIAAAKGVA